MVTAKMSSTYRLKKTGTSEVLTLVKAFPSRCSMKTSARMSDNGLPIGAPSRCKKKPSWNLNQFPSFMQKETNFSKQSITTITLWLTKCYYTIASVTDAIGADVADLLEAAKDKPYEVVKATLLDKFTATAEDSSQH
ncbi:hypothetical protein M514_08422 [Trichuris suis]|uniref:Uncharacterized protein n=1 Tax=Trichuris suis TaxID=68888 RepID=A0A085M0M0_9BILA|nr:hypothetical protein M513_08422 [Trichuris suis]KFD59893.1 hypothetical protein M514_08422 [Trichuris suis]